MILIKKKEIILAGENLARNYFANNPFEFTSKKKEKSLPQIPQKLFISSIKVEGNNHLSKSKIKEYISLQAKEKYSKKQIITAIKKTYNSQLFAVIYPVLTNSKDGYILTIKVKEKERKRLGINLVYNSNSEIMMGLTLDLNNIIQRNSKLLANLQIGNKNSFKLDYVKNFGKHYGVYFRLFPNITEEKLYEYDLETHQKISREKSLEIGNTLGIGLFATEAIILEAYGYGFKKRIYREENSEYHSAGIGLKCYHESLDDFAFPMKGAQFLLKYSSAKKGVFSEDGNRKFFSKIKILFPFGENISLKYQFEYGSYFEDSNVNFDPFYVGGFDSFMGLNSKELSAPIYKINTLALRIEPWKSVFCDFQFNILNLGDVDYWDYFSPEIDLYRGFGIRIGYNSILGPLRAGFALDKENNDYYYISLGYEFDQFMFSGR